MFFSAKCRQTIPRWQQAAALVAEVEALVPADRRGFFQTHVLTEINVHFHWNEMLSDLAGSASPWASPAMRSGAMRAAIKEIRALMKTVQKADYGKWQGFHTRGDWFDNAPLTLALAQTCKSKLRGKTLSPAQREVLKTAGHYLNRDTSNVYITYQKGHKAPFCTPPGRNQ
jgi:hypothetical protein